MKHVTGECEIVDRKLRIIYNISIQRWEYICPFEMSTKTNKQTKKAFREYHSNETRFKNDIKADFI